MYTTTINIILKTFVQSIFLLTISIVMACNNSQTKTDNSLSTETKPFSLNFEQLEQQNKINPKKSLIYIYDPNCEDCTRVRMYALENPENEAYMQQYFYTADISIHHKNDIQFNNNTYQYKQDVVGRPYHQLAQALNQAESISTPCLSFLDENLNLIVPIKKAVTAQELEVLLVFVATDSFKKMPIEQFQQQYQKGSYTVPY